MRRNLWLAATVSSKTGRTSVSTQTAEITFLHYLAQNYQHFSLMISQFFTSRKSFKFCSAHRCTPAGSHTCTPAGSHTCTQAGSHTCTPAGSHTCTQAGSHTCTQAGYKKKHAVDVAESAGQGIFLPCTKPWARLELGRLMLFHQDIPVLHY
jgi:hypothetical protein